VTTDSLNKINDLLKNGRLTVNVTGWNKPMIDFLMQGAVAELMYKREEMKALTVLLKEAHQAVKIVQAYKDIPCDHDYTDWLKQVEEMK